MRELPDPEDDFGSWRRGSCRKTATAFGAHSSSGIPGRLQTREGDQAKSQKATRNLMAPGTVDALLFDVVGVVIRIDFNRAFARWATLAACDPALLRQRFLQDPP